MVREPGRRIAAVLAMLVLIAAACGSDESPTADAQPAAQESTAEVVEVPTTESPDGSPDIEVAARAEQICLPHELCVEISGSETTGQDLRLLLYEATAERWPHDYRSVPTPSWVVSEYPPVPDSFPTRISIAFEENLFAIASTPLEGAELGLAVVTGAASIMTVDATDARGFSESTLVYEPDTPMDFGTVRLELPAGDTCELNPYHPDCLTAGMFWKEHYLGDEGFVPGAVYLDVADIDGDGMADIVTVGEPHFENPDLPLTDLKLAVYYLNPDLTLRETEVIDQWTEADPTFYSAWGVKVVDHGGEPVIVVGTNIPDLAPLEDGSGAVLGYRRVGDAWERTEIVANPDPRTTNYNAMIVVACDIDQDGDDDLALSSAFGTSSVGNWMENTGAEAPGWTPHYQEMAPGMDPAVRGVLAYKCVDLDGDDYPEVAYNAMFDIPDTDPPRYRGEIWFGHNPGPDGWDEPWDTIVVDDDNWASADMWFHDFDEDGHLDLIANQIFSSTVTRYWHPGDDLTARWVPEVVISGLTSPSDMWLTDMDGDGAVDVVSADHTAHNGVWHRNPGVASTEWTGASIFRGIGMPGDFAMADIDGDGDLDWVGVSMTLGQAFLVEQVAPASSAVVRLSMPDDFDQAVTKLVVTLASEVPVIGMPVALLAIVDNVDNDGDGRLDVDQILNADSDVVLTFDDVGLTGDYHVVAAVYVEGGGEFQPVAGLDYLAASEPLQFGAGPVDTELELAVYTG